MGKEMDVRLQYLYPNFEIYMINLIWGTFSDRNQHNSISTHGARGKQWNSCCTANPSLSPDARHQVSPRQFGGMQALALDKQLKHLALSSLNLPGYAAAPTTLVLHIGFVTTGALARV